MRSQPAVSERAGRVQQGRTMLEVLSRELRQGESVLTPTTSGLSVVTYVNSAACGGAYATNSILCRVTYTCGSTSCTRTERNPDGSGTGSAETIVRGITGPNVFSYQGTPGDPSYVGIRLVFPADDGSEAITLDDGAANLPYSRSIVSGVAALLRIRIRCRNVTDLPGSSVSVSSSCFGSKTFRPKTLAENSPYPRACQYVGEFGFDG